MKKFIAVTLSAALIATQFVPVLADSLVPVVISAEVPATNLMPLMISGKIEKEADGSILVKPYNDKDESVILNVSDSTYIIDAVTGRPMMLKDRIGDDIIAYYGPIQTKSMPAKSNAVAILCSLPQDYKAPYYAKVEALEKGDNEVKVTINNGSIIATIKGDVPISPFKTKNIVAIGNIAVGTELLLWSDAATMSFPGNTTVTKAVILGTSNPTDSTDTSSASFMVEKKTVSSDNKKVMGVLPQFTGISDGMFADKLSAFVNGVYDAGMKEASKDSNNEVKFSFENITFKNYTSIIIHTDISAGNTSSGKAATLVLDNVKNKQYMLNDILGTNAYKLANSFINKQISTAKEGVYFTDENAFNGIKSEPNFYIDQKGNANIIFDKYSIAPGASGMPTFSIPMDSVINYELAANQVYVDQSTRMIPLRQVAEALGYELKWDGDTQTIDLTKGGKTHTITINKNQYDQRQLEFAPMIKDGTTYVPISCFEVLLGACYTVNETNILFSIFK